MDYSVIAEAYEKIEATTKRLEMTDLLVDLLKKTPKEVIAKVVYLTQGKLYPDFLGVEMGVAEKLAIKALARASGASETTISADLQSSGDIGETAQKFLTKRRQSTFLAKNSRLSGSTRRWTSWLRLRVQAPWTRRWRCFAVS